MLLIALRSVGSWRNSLRSSGQSFYQQPFSSVDRSSPTDCSVSFSYAVTNVVRYPGFTDKKRLPASIRCTAEGEASFVEWMIPWLSGYRSDVEVLDRYPTSILGLARPRIRICGFPGSLWRTVFNPLKPELNPICYLLALLGAHHFLHVSRIRVKLLTFRLLMSYIYIYIWSTHSWCF